MKHISRLIALLAASLALPALAIQPGDKVENFTLKDTRGKPVELYSLKDKDAVVVMIQGNGCPIVRNAIHTYHKVQERYEPKNVAFLLLNANIQDNANSIANEAKEFKFNVPVLVDKDQDVARKWEVERTADTFVIDPSDWTLAYRGELDDRLGYETQKIESSKQYVADALDAVLHDKPVRVPYTDAKGCLVAILDQ